LVATLAGQSIDRVVASPLARCVETVRPVATSRRLDIECRHELAPDAPIEDTISLLAGLSDTTLVCTDREVIERVLGGTVECEKAGAWIIERRRHAWTPVAYLPPPRHAPKRSAKQATLVG
jgi:phosphohistidine phosphatase SixA